MRFASTVLFALGLGFCQAADLDSLPIWQYQPTHKVTDEAAMDRDLHSIVKELRNKEFLNAERIYKEGGHSGSYALLHLDNPIVENVPDGTHVYGPSPYDKQGARGKVVGDIEKGASSITVLYQVLNDMTDHQQCQVGALEETYTVGCFNATGKITFENSDNAAQYHYNPDQENRNTNSISSMNADVSNLWSDSDYIFKFVEYYGTHNYLDEITKAAFHFEEAPGLHRGKMDFSMYQEKGNKEIIEFAVPTMTMVAWIVGMMEDAVAQCNRGCDHPNGHCSQQPGKYPWDLAVAYYTGSRLDLPNDKGDFMFAFADARCSEFRTCGMDAKSAIGFAKVNHDIFKLFNEGQKLLEDVDCAGVRKTKERVQTKLTIPLIQGVLRYAHMVQGEMIVGNIEKHNAEASIFALSVLPLVHACSPLDAEIIYDHLKPKPTTKVDYQVVKHAFEKNYDCMNIKCHEIGGIYDAHNGTYRYDSIPCGVFETSALTSSKGGKWLLSIIVIVSVFVLFGVACCLRRRCQRRGNGIETKGDDSLATDDEHINIAGSSAMEEHEIA